MHFAKHLKHGAMLNKIRKTLICLGINPNAAKCSLQVAQLVGDASDGASAIGRTISICWLPEHHCRVASQGKRLANLKDVRVLRNEVPFYPRHQRVES